MISKHGARDRPNKNIPPRQPLGNPFGLPGERKWMETAGLGMKTAAILCVISDVVAFNLE